MTMNQIHEQTVSEVCRLALLETDEAAAEIIRCFADLTQIQALYVSAKASAQLGWKCQLLATAISGRSIDSLESEISPLLKLHRQGGIDMLIKDLSQRPTIAGITMIPLLQSFRGIGDDLASRLISISNDQITEFA